MEQEKLSGDIQFTLIAEQANRTPHDSANTGSAFY